MLLWVDLIVLLMILKVGVMWKNLLKSKLHKSKHSILRLCKDSNIRCYFLPLEFFFEFLDSGIHLVLWLSHRLQLLPQYLPLPRQLVHFGNKVIFDNI